MIHSITTTPEETVLVESESGGLVGQKWADNSLPQQLHISKLPSGSLYLGPGQVAIVPITFLPRYPDWDVLGDQRGSHDDAHNYDDNNLLDESDHFYRNGKSPPPLSSTARLDLVDLVGEGVLKVIEDSNNYYHANSKQQGITKNSRHSDDYLRSSNLDPSPLPKGQKYEVSTTVLVSTSKGDMDVDMTVSSARNNPYGIPDVIKVRHPQLAKADYLSDCGATGGEGTGSFATISSDGVVIMDIVHAHDDRKQFHGEMHSERDCYDLYMSNPFPDKDLQIVEALISRPEVMSLQLDPPQASTTRAWSLLETDDNSFRTQRTQVIREWTSDGTLSLPPGPERHYVLTLCTASGGEVERDEDSEPYLNEMARWMGAGNPNRDLGFLQIRTDAHTLFVVLEHDEMPPFFSLKNESFAGIGETNRTRHQLAAASPTLLPGAGMSSTAGLTSSSLLKSYPESLYFEMMSTTSPMVQAKLSLQNKSPVPIRIMRVSVGMDTFGDKAKIQEAKQIGLKLNVSVISGGKANMQDQLDSLVLGPAASLDDVLVLSCSVNPDGSFSDSNKESFQFNGTMIVRGTMDTELTYQEWRDETRRNPFRDEHLTLELPFFVSVLNGRVEARIERSTHPYPQLFASQPWDRSGQTVSYLFFPMTQFRAEEGTEGVLPVQNYIDTNEIRHDLRVLSNMKFPLIIESAEIVDTSENSNNADSLCGRFNVSIAPTPEVGTTYKGFEEVSSLKLRYKFGAAQGGGKQRDTLSSIYGSIEPTSCTLDVKTSPEDAGVFRIPLMIFTSHLDVSTTDPSAGSSHEPNRTGTVVRMGYNSLLSWSRSTRLGQTFIEFLSRLSNDRKRNKSDSQLLSKYVSQFSRRPNSQSKPKFHPILLDIGTIDHGEIAKIPLYFTNINPVPVSLSIDVGEVEGSMIVLGRDPSQTRGDGNSLFDHLPNGVPSTLSPKGKFNGHPIDGLLQFMTTNEKTLDFISEYNFRDSVSPNKVAFSKFPVLESLYNWHAQASFRRAQLPSRFKCNNGSHCEENPHPPLYMPFNDSYRTNLFEGMPGALLLSGDKKLAHKLKQYWERDTKSGAVSDGTTVHIPPGGTARFEIHLRAPPKDYLVNDINQLMASGLVLSTNLGDVMPIFTVFEALQGQLHASQVQPLPQIRGGIEFGPQLEQQINTTIVHVPLELLWGSQSIAKHSRGSESFHSSTIWDASRNSTVPFSSDVGVPLFLKSSFSRQVRLLNIESCNPWFQFIPLSFGERLEPYEENGIKVGYMRTAVDCSQEISSHFEFPNYYQCVLNWLSMRVKLQPRGCGLNRIQDSSANLRKIEGVKKSVEYALRVLKKTYAHSYVVNLNNSDFWTADSGHVKTRDARRRDGLISNLDSFSVVWASLKVASAFGYDWLSSSLRATVQYNALSNDIVGETTTTIEQNLSLSIRDLEVKSILQPPRLFDPDGRRKEDSSSNVLEFSSTPIASVAKAVIYLSNPTGTAVKIRLGAVQGDSKIRRSQGESSPDATFGHSIEGWPPPYVQNGKRSIVTNETLEHLWWDGDGAFFLADNHGDVIRSHHNITIRAGAGAFVSLVNPSLHANVGFLVGCGARCGIRDETQSFMAIEHPMFNSPIGASAAAGVTLSGMKRSSSPQSNALVGPEPSIPAGGTPVPNSDGPAAFAIPYSALEEIVIAPYGRGELGPIFFRPPGRYGVIGCDVARESGARLRGEKKDLCTQHSFEAVVFLENTLTGLEKIVLRGKSVWDRVYFVDPPPRDGQDAFGDIELRNGRPTLLFSGTSVASINSARDSLAGAGPHQQSVVKEVVLQNDGDAPVEIAAVYLSSVVGRGDGGAQVPCTHGTFTLLDCWDPDYLKRDSESQTVENFLTGLILEAGENRSFFIEHKPDCSKKEEFLNLIVQMKQGDPHDLGSGKSFPSSFPGGRRSSRSQALHNPFAGKETSLILGYQMDDADFARCTPVNARISRGAMYTPILTRPGNGSELLTDLGYVVRRKNTYLIIEVVLFTSAALLLCYALRARFNAMWSMLLKMPMYLVKRGQQNGLLSRKLRSHWNAAFRCLSRADPASTELQTLSREQMRQVVLGQYKAMGTTPPAAVSGASAFTRDRRNCTSSTLRQRTGKENASGNERIITLSEAIFHDTSIENGLSLRKCLPVGLGWRTAYTRGILKDTSIYSTTLELRTRALRKRRTTSFEKASEDSDESGYQEEDEEHDTSDGSPVKIGHISTPQNSDQSVLVECNGNAVEVAEALSVISTSESEGTDPSKFDTVKIQDDGRKEKRKFGPDGRKQASAKSVEIMRSTHIAGTEDEKHESKTEEGEHKVAKKHGASKVDNSNMDVGDTKVASQFEGTSFRQHLSESDQTPQTQPTHDKVKEEVAQENGLSQKAPKQIPSNRNRPNASTKSLGKESGIAEKKPGSSRTKGKSKGKHGPAGFKTKHRHGDVDDEQVQSVDMPTCATPEPILRPPPGLAPPPGFGGSPTTISAKSAPMLSNPVDALDTSLLSLEMMLDSNSNIDLPLMGPQSDVTLPFSRGATVGSDLFFTRNTVGEFRSTTADAAADTFGFPVSQSPTITRLGTAVSGSRGGEILRRPHAEPVIPMLLNEAESNQDGFDVMDFLDSILNEGAPMVQPEEPDVNARTDAAVGLTGSAAPVLDNPWATEGRSRAAAYGISFDEDDDNSSNASPIFGVLLEGNSVEDGPPGLGNIPLLTPAAIFNAEQDEDVDEGDIVVSFYAGLVDE